MWNPVIKTKYPTQLVSFYFPKYKIKQEK